LGFSTQYSSDTYYRPAVLYNSGRSLVLRTLCSIVHITDWSLLESRGLYKDCVRDTLLSLVRYGCAVPLCCCVEIQLHPLARVWWIRYIRLSFTTACLVPLAAPVAGSWGCSGRSQLSCWGGTVLTRGCKSLTSWKKSQRSIRPTRILHGHLALLYLLLKRSFRPCRSDSNYRWPIFRTRRTPSPPTSDGSI
jgi:hypothetical protein